MNLDAHLYQEDLRHWRNSDEGRSKGRKSTECVRSRVGVINETSCMTKCAQVGISQSGKKYANSRYKLAPFFFDVIHLTRLTVRAPYLGKVIKRL